jgi:hypothetical protein
MRRRIGTVFTVALAFLALAFSQGVASASVTQPPAGTPQLATSASDGTIEQVRQLTICNTGPGGTPIVYAVGLFTNVKNWNSTNVIVRKNAFAFAATSPYQVTSWDPEVSGQVDTVACAPDGNILIGGVFGAVGATTTGVHNIAKVDPTTGATVPFTPSPVFNGRIAHIEVVQGHALVGGYFTATAASGTTPAGAGYLRSISPITGVVDGYTMPTISGHYSYNDTSFSPARPASSNPTRIWNMSVSPDGTAVLMTGDFTSVGGLPRQQIFRLNMGTTGGTVSAWYPSELNSNCYYREPFWAQDAAWSPDGKFVYVATTGYRLAGDANPNSHARTGPCDAAIAYSAAETPITGHTWINYTGCDSLFSVAADTSTVFIAGHQRNIDNGAKGGCDTDTPPAPGRKQPGLGEITPSTGLSQPGPSRGRGLGADDLIRTADGLWIASDNQANTSTCAGKSGHMGICYLPN